MPRKSQALDAEEIILSLEGARHFHAAALLLATLACPQPKEMGLRINLFESIYCHLVIAQCDVDPDWSKQEQAVIPLYLLRSKEEAKKDWRALYRRMRDRTDAVRVALPFLMHAEAGRHSLPKGVRLTIASILDHYKDEMDSRRVDNFYGRIWSPGLPVLHLNAALERLSHEYASNGTGIDILTSLSSRDFVRKWIDLAQNTEPLLAKSKLKIDPRSLIRFRLGADT